MGETTCPPLLGLGLDVGGTQSRWALADAGGEVLAEGTVPAFSGQQVHSEDGRVQIEAAWQALARAVQAAGVDAPARLWAGVTGFDGESGPELARIVVRALALAPAALRLFNDVELAHRICFDPGEGYLVYAGTGSIGVFVDAGGGFHRVGGRGGVLGDEGSGYGIARDALSAVWRREDEEPGFQAGSVLARHLFAALGGSGWDSTRRFLQQRSRGAFGELALAVAAAARDDDPLAQDILRRAGVELARLARLLVQRHGLRPVVVTGRAASLHPLIEQALREALPDGISVALRPLQTHRAAAAAAAREANQAGQVAEGAPRAG